MHVASFPVTASSYLNSGKPRHLTHVVSADWTLQLPLRGVLGSKGPLIILRGPNSAEHRNSMCTGVAPTSFLHAGLKIATIRPTMLRLEEEIFIQAEGILKGKCVFYMNNLVCPRCGSLLDIMFCIWAAAAREVCSDVAQRNGSEKHAAQQ